MAVCFSTQPTLIHDIARQHDKALELNLKAIREKSNPVLHLDLASRYARYMKDPIKGRAALAEAEKSTLVDSAKPGYLRCRGILAFLEGDYIEAKRELEAAIETLQKNPHAPYYDGRINIAKAYLCQVVAKLGDHSAARKNFMDAEKYLIATSETELLEQCSKATGAQA